MARTKVSHYLGPLPSRAVVSSAQYRGDSLLQTLRALALKNQREQPRAFYSLREVARHFRASVSSIAKLYHELESEGLLSRVRGSKTILNGVSESRQLSIRGFVALPAITSTFLTIPEYRNFLSAIRHELWSRGFAATIVFHKPAEAGEPIVSERLKNYGVDTAIWLHPGRLAKESMLRLSDHGIRVVAISSVGTPSMPSRYYLWRERGVAAILADWRNRHSVRKVTMIESKEYRSPVTEEVIRVMLGVFEIETTVRIFSGDQPARLLSDLGRLKTDGIVFPAAGLLARFAFQTPKPFTELLKAQRVAFIDGPVDLPFTAIPDAQVDLVTFAWQKVAETIVDDLISRQAYEQNRHTTFDAEGHLRVPLRNFCEEIQPFRSIGSHL